MEVRRINAFGISITAHTISEYIHIIDESIKSGDTFIQQTGVNAYSIVCLKSDVNMKDAINKSQLVNIDGISVAWALRFLGYKDIRKASCPDIFYKLLELAEVRGYRPFFLGAKPDVIEKAICNIKTKYANLEIAGYHHGYFNEKESDYLAKKIKESKADMLFLGMPSPHKELFSHKYTNTMEVPYIFGVGGMFDILANVTKRAPTWMQNIGLEWLYRFSQEPRRLWSRYTIGNLKFLYYVFKEKIRHE